MGFPVPLKEWAAGELGGFIQDIFSVQRAKHRPYFNTDAVLAGIGEMGQFSRKLWGLLSLEIWHQTFHDRSIDLRLAAEGDRTPPAGTRSVAASMG